MLEPFSPSMPSGLVGRYLYAATLSLSLHTDLLKYNDNNNNNNTLCMYGVLLGILPHEHMPGSGITLSCMLKYRVAICTCIVLFLSYQEKSWDCTSCLSAVGASWPGAFFFLPPAPLFFSFPSFPLMTHRLETLA